jgi:hypothetical protein
MTFTYDPTTPLGLCRLLAKDTDSENPVFEDEELDALLTLEEGDVRYAAATALEGRATEQALILRITEILTPGLKVDGVSGARAVMAYAASLRLQSDRAVEGSFDIAEQVFSPDGFRQRILNQRLRGAI